MAPYFAVLRAYHLFLFYRTYREQHGPGSMGEVNGGLWQGGLEHENIVASAFRLVT